MKTKLEQIKDKLIEIEQAQDRDDANKMYNELENLFDDGSIWWLVERVEELEKKHKFGSEQMELLVKNHNRLDMENKRYRDFFQKILDLQLYINYTETELWNEVLKICDEYLESESNE